MLRNINPWWFVALLPLSYLLWEIVAEIRIRRRLKKRRERNDRN
jgi:hypothetical protein